MCIIILIILISYNKNICEHHEFYYTHYILKIFARKQNIVIKNFKTTTFFFSPFSIAASILLVGSNKLDPWSSNLNPDENNLDSAFFWILAFTVVTWTS